NRARSSRIASRSAVETGRWYAAEEAERTHSTDKSASAARGRTVRPGPGRAGHRGPVAQDGTAMAKRRRERPIAGERDESSAEEVSPELALPTWPPAGWYHLHRGYTDLGLIRCRL